MKPIIKKSDYNTLSKLISLSEENIPHRDALTLKMELDRADIVEDHQIDGDIITIDSYFEAEDLNNNTLWKFKLTLPENANLELKHISVLSPLGIALIGFREKSMFQWPVPGGHKNIQISKVIQNPHF